MIQQTLWLCSIKKFEETRLKKGKYYGATWQDKVKIDWDEDDTILSKAPMLV
jgi:hypothetical protein